MNHHRAGESNPSNAAGRGPGSARAGASLSRHAAASTTQVLITEHLAGRAGSGLFDEIEDRANAGDRAAQNYLGWNLSA